MFASVFALIYFTAMMYWAYDVHPPVSAIESTMPQLPLRT
jgi:hypothetical protein